jgi:hypothetical protein
MDINMAVNKTTFQQVVIKVKPYLDKKVLRHDDNPMSVDDSDVIISSLDSESEKQLRVSVKKEGFKVKPPKESHIIGLSRFS